MSLNLIDSPLLNARFNNVFLSNDLNIDVANAVAGSELVVQEDLSLAWEDTSDEASTALEHYQSFFQEITFTDSNFAFYPLTNVPSLPDPLGNINTLDNVIRIDTNLKAIFMMIVKYIVFPPVSHACYEFKVQRKFSELPDDEVPWTDYGFYGRACSSLVTSNFSNQSLTCQFPIDSYSPTGLNTYIRFLYQKLEPSYPDILSDLRSCVTLIRLV